MNRRNLVRLREETNLNASAFAAKAGVPQSLMSRLEAGERTCKAETLRRIADALGELLGKDVGEVMVALTDPQ